jgi:hypothetical protein
VLTTYEAESYRRSEDYVASDPEVDVTTTNPMDASRFCMEFLWPKYMMITVRMTVEWVTTVLD